MFRFLILLFLLPLIAMPALAGPLDACSRKPVPKVAVHMIFDEPRYDFSKDLAGMQHMADDASHSIPHYHATAMGITRYSPVIEFQVPLVVEKTGANPACAHIDHIDVSVGYRNVTVFVANDIPEGSCGRGETIAHEQKHIAANREVLDKFVPLIRARFEDYARLSGNFRTTNADEAEKVVQARLHAMMDEVMDKMHAENMRRQREVDSREEYYRLAQACNGELSHIAQRYHQNNR